MKIQGREIRGSWDVERTVNDRPARLLLGRLVRDDRPGKQEYTEYLWPWRISEGDYFQKVISSETEAFGITFVYLG